MSSNCYKCGEEYPTSSLTCMNPNCLTNIANQLRILGVPPDEVQASSPEQFDDGYESLRNTLIKASEQASKTKGVERHASGEPFEQQKICQGGRKFGVGAPLYQTWKKTEEAYRMATSDKFENGKERAIQELYGAINYAAAAIIVLNEQIDKEKREKNG